MYQSVGARDSMLVRAGSLTQQIERWSLGVCICCWWCFCYISNPFTSMTIGGSSSSSMLLLDFQYERESRTLLEIAAFSYVCMYVWYAQWNLTSKQPHAQRHHCSYPSLIVRALPIRFLHLAVLETCENECLHSPGLPSPRKTNLFQVVVDLVVDTGYTWANQQSVTRPFVWP